MAAMYARPPQDGQTHDGQDLAILFAILSSLMWFGLQPSPALKPATTLLSSLLCYHRARNLEVSPQSMVVSSRCTVVIRRVGIFSLPVVG